ncbi:MAG: DMT family transporter [Arcobacter sp.]|uniref:DMT family transporter n=1 Tax=Arcobacter sp. TaxID=1872629 RepID=UPI003AFFE01E
MDTETSQGIKLMLFASLLFAFMGAFAKELSSSMSSVEVVFFRNIFGVVLIALSLYKKPIMQKGGKPWLLFFRGFVGFAALLMFFYNISNISLAQAMTFSKTSTIFTALFAYIFIKEKLGFKGWIGIFIGFIGILFITKFDGGSLEKTDWLGILTGVGAGLAYTSVRELRTYYDTRVIVLSFMTIGSIGPAILMFIGNYYTNDTFDFLFGEFVIPSLSDWVFIILMGTTATFAQVFMTKAYASAKAGIVGTISYSTLIFAIALGMILGDKFPDIWIILGIILIVISGVLASGKKKE